MNRRDFTALAVVAPVALQSKTWLEIIETKDGPHLLNWNGKVHGVSPDIAYGMEISGKRSDGFTYRVCGFTYTEESRDRLSAPLRLMLDSFLSPECTCKTGDERRCGHHRDIRYGYLQGADQINKIRRQSKDDAWFESPRKRVEVRELVMGEQNAS